MRDGSPSDESSYEARFYFDPNSLALNSGNFTIFRLHGLGDPAVLAVDLGYQPGADDYQLVVSVREDSGEWVFYPVSLIADGPHALEISWGAASGSGAEDGWLRYWIDGELAFEDFTIDNGDQRVTAAELGVRNVPDITAQGVICFDEFASATAGYIGEVVGVHGCSAAMEAGEGTPSQSQAPRSIFLPIAANGDAPTAPPPPPAIAAVTTITYTTVITYAYDDLYRLTSASYNSGNSFGYGYDSVGNRMELQHCLSGQGCTSTTYTYDAGNRLTSVDDGTGAVGYTWDGNGNLLDDGANAYDYDSANRLSEVDDGVAVSTNAYNGLGDRLSLTEGITTTQFTLDLAIGLTQVLDDEERTYFYGNTRLAQDDGVDTEYFLVDALGSMRQLADVAGEPTLVQDYKPYGEVLSSTGSGLTNYGFTGEWMDNYNKLVYLRSRYYAPEIGMFLTKDVWPSVNTRPQSLSRWNYVEGNPVNLTDPTGMFPDWCKSMTSKFSYEDCVLSYYQVRRIGNTEAATANVIGSPGCYSGPIEYRAGGYLEGLGGFLFFTWLGEEIVYDFATMQSEVFGYGGPGVNDSFIGGGISTYAGAISGFRSDVSIGTAYSGSFLVVQGGGGLDLGEIGQVLGAGAGVVGFFSPTDFRLYGASWYVGTGVSVDIIPGLELGGAWLIYFPNDNTLKEYTSVDGKSVDRSALINDIQTGYRSRWPFFIEATSIAQASRSLAQLAALRYANVYEQIHNAK